MITSGDIVRSRYRDSRPEKARTNIYRSCEWTVTLFDEYYSFLDPIKDVTSEDMLVIAVRDSYAYVIVGSVVGFIDLNSIEKCDANVA